MCLHAQACHLIQTISSRLWVLDKALQEHEPEYPGVHGLQEDGEKALSGAVRESAGTGGSREANPRDLGAEDRSLAHSKSCPTPSATAACPAQGSPMRMCPHMQGENPSLSAVFLPWPLSPSPASPPCVSSLLAQAM